MHLELYIETETLDLEKISESMREIMLAEKGVGIAANQVGLDRRIVVNKIPELDLLVINPEIVNRKSSQLSTESCLSIPGFSFQPPFQAFRNRVSGTPPVFS